MEYSVVKAVSLTRKIVKECGSENKIDILRVIKLLYLCERLHYASFKKFITGDALVSMQYGPVLSRTYDLIRDNPLNLPDSDHKYWGGNFETKGHAIIMRNEPQSHHLDDYEIFVADRIIESCGSMETWDLVNALHNTLLEWKDTKSSTPIEKSTLDEILIPIDEERINRLLRVPILT